MGNNLISWFNKKQNYVSLSTIEAEYIAVVSIYTQLLWMRQMLKEYNVKQDVMTLCSDIMTAINNSKNPIQHSRTKHVDIHHHLISDPVEENVITLNDVSIENQLADIFNKELDTAHFEKLRNSLGLCIVQNI